MTRPRAISLWQPWAHLWSRGLKRCETRSWRPSGGGWYLVHAGLANDADVRVAAEPLRTMFPDIDFRTLPRGCFVGRVHVVYALEMTPRLIAEQTDTELACGWWEPGRYAWVADGFVTFPTPVPAKGRQGVWTVTDWSDPDDAVEVGL